MSIDLICLLILAFAAFRGYRKGFIIALASFAGYFIGLAAALKLSATAASQMEPGNPWVPFLAFAIVFLITVWLVSLLGKALHKAAEMMMAGPINRIGGIIMYLFIYTLIISLLLFFAGQLGLLSKSTMSSSVTCRYLEPLGRKWMEVLGQWIPFFRDMFGQLLDFFEGVNRELKES